MRYYVMNIKTLMFATEDDYTKNVEEAYLCESAKDAQNWIDYNFDFPEDFVVVARR